MYRNVKEGLAWQEIQGFSFMNEIVWDAEFGVFPNCLLETVGSCMIQL
jgi:hypothetical protein